MKATSAKVYNAAVRRSKKRPDEGKLPYTGYPPRKKNIKRTYNAVRNLQRTIR